MSYHILETADIPGYLRERGLWDERQAEVREVSDGNMNRVFVATGPGRSLALKQALPWVRVAGPSWPMTPERAVAEARAYAQVAGFAADLIPRIEAFDERNYVLVMEDMSDLTVLRTALNNGGSFDGASARIGEFVAGLSFATSDFGMSSAARKKLVAHSVNPALCKITEDLVLSEPYLDHEHNRWHPGVTDLAEELRRDAVLRTEVAALRHRFMTSAQALLHGDLHTGSVMVGRRGGADVVRVFDPEFSFVGPIGFDLGLYWANVLIAELRAVALNAVTDHPAQLGLCWDAFEHSFLTLWPSRVDTFFPDAYLDRFLREVFTDALGFAGAEMVRRVIGYAHVTDLTTLPDVAPAAAAVLRLARGLILQRAELAGVTDVRELVEEEAERRRLVARGRL